MKPPLTAALHGTGLLLAFAAGWWLKPPASPGPAASSVQGSATPSRDQAHPSKSALPAGTFQVPWLESAVADIAAIRAAMRPGVVNQVLVEKLQAILNNTDHFHRLASWQALIAEMRPEDALAVQKIFSDLDKDGRWAHQELLAFLNHWGRIDGPAAILHLAKAGSNAPSVNKIGSVMEGWGRSDPAAALEWLATADTRLSIPAGVTGWCQGAAAADFATAEKLLLKNFETYHQTPFLAELAKFKIQQSGLGEAGQWFKTVAAGNYPDAYKLESLNALTQLTQRLESLPDGTASGISATISPYAHEPWLPENAGQALGKQWAQGDRSAGMLEIQNMTSPLGRDAAYSELTRHWAAAEPGSLSVWLNENKSHPAFDEAACQLVRSLGSNDPEASKAWIAQIKDPAIRSKATGPRIDWSVFNRPGHTHEMIK